MSKKKLLFSVFAVIAIIAVVFTLTGCDDEDSSSSKKSNKSGFESKFTDANDKENKLKNYPKMKEAMIDLESKILDSGLKVEEIVFSNYGMTGVYYLERTGMADSYILLDFDLDSETDEYKFYSVTAKLFDESKYEKARDAMVKYVGLSEDEAKIVDEITTEDGVQTMEYYIGYYERKETVYPDMSKIETESYEEYQEKASESKEVPYIELEILSHPAEDEKQTNLYKVKREERKPKADGQNVDEYGLSFYIPNQMTANSYNGMLYTWEYYTGDFVGYYPNGVDVTLTISGLKDKDIDTYVRNDSKPAKSTGVTPFEIKTINGKEWYTCNNGTIYYYGAEFMDNVYEIEVKNGEVIDGVTLEAVMDMIEKTLFFE